MKTSLTILLLYLPILLNAQSLKRILNRDQLDSVKNGFEIIKIIDKTNCKSFFGLQGKIKIFRYNNKLDFNYIGDMESFFDNGNLKSQYVFDNNGLSKSYNEFTNNGEVIYDCTYEYKQINGAIYRLEHLKLYYEPNKLMQEGNRYMLYKKSNGGKHNSKQRKYGKWTYYTPEGIVEKTKDYRKIK